MTRTCLALLASLLLFPCLCRSQSATAQGCEPNRLARAKEFYSNNDLSQAEALLRQLENCPNAIGVNAKQLLAQIANARNCSPIRNQALSARNRGNHDSACLFVAEIERTCPNWDRLTELKGLIGECRKPSTLDEDFNQALALHRSCEWNKAILLLRQIKEKNPGFPGMEKEIEAVQKDIDAIKSADDLRNRGRLEEARRALGSAKAGSAACPPVDSELESLRRDIDDIRKADSACSSGNSKSALSTLEAVRERNPSYDWLDREIENAQNGAKCGSLPPKPDIANADYLAKAQAAFQERDYSKARMLLKEALSLGRVDPKAKALIAEVDRLDRPHRLAVRNALQAYYRGDFKQADLLLRNVIISGEASPLSKTLAKFYLGAALLSTYYLGGESMPNIESEAMGHFRQVRSEAPKFIPPSIGISKRILDRFNTGK